MSKKEQILKLLKAGKAIGEVAKAVKVKPAYVYYIRWMDLNKSGKKAGKKAKKKAKLQRDRELALVRARDSRMLKEVKEVKQALDALEKPKVTRKELLDELKPGLNALFGKKPTKLIVQPQYRDAAVKILADNDLVNHPPHYKAGGVETIDFIEAKDLNYRLGNVVKYVSRAGRKDTDPVQDLEKAAWYLQREIAARKNA